jgi:hypothetical protein
MGEIWSLKGLTQESEGINVGAGLTWPSDMSNLPSKKWQPIKRHDWLMWNGKGFFGFFKIYKYTNFRLSQGHKSKFNIPWVKNSLQVKGQFMAHFMWYHRTGPISRIECASIHSSIYV